MKRQYSKADTFNFHKTWSLREKLCQVAHIQDANEMILKITKQLVCQGMLQKDIIEKINAIQPNI